MSSQPNNLSQKASLLILAAICLAALILPLSFSAGAVATPIIGRQLGGSTTSLIWITNAFMLAFGSSLMAAGALADAYGRKRLFATGVGAFALLSLMLAAAPSVFWIDVLRALQGLAAAAALSGGSAALAQVFEGQARTRAFSMLGTSFGTGLAFGPLLAGFLIEHWGWRSIFLFIAIVAIAALLFGVPRMHESRDPQASGLDLPGAATFTMTLVLLTSGIVEATDHRWNSALVLSLLIASAIFAALFVIVERRVKRPMLDLALFRYPRFIGVQVLPIGTCYCYIVLLVLLPLRFIGVNGLSEIDAGILMLALSAPMLVVPSLASWLTRWLSPGVLSGTGLLIAAAGLYLLGRVGIRETGSALVLPMLMIGCGTGLPWGLMDGLSVSVVPKDRAGMATGIFSTTRVAGEGIALAIVTAVLAALTQSRLSQLLTDENARAGASICEASASLSSGNLAHAVLQLPGISRAIMVTQYGEAFKTLLHLLVAITLISSLVVFALLAKPGRSGAIVESGATLVSTSD